MPYIASSPIPVPHVIPRVREQRVERASPGIALIIQARYDKCRASLPENVPVIRASGKCINQADAFAALETPVPPFQPRKPAVDASREQRVTPSVDEPRELTVTPAADACRTLPMLPEEDARPAELQTETVPATTPADPVLVLAEIKHQLKLHRRAYLKLRCPFTSAKNLPLPLPTSKKAQALDYLRGKVLHLTAAKKDIQGTRSFTSHVFSSLMELCLRV
jgi:hypothetical protein